MSILRIRIDFGKRIFRSSIACQVTQNSSLVFLYLLTIHFSLLLPESFKFFFHFSLNFSIYLIIGRLHLIRYSSWLFGLQIISISFLRFLILSIDSIQIKIVHFFLSWRRHIMMSRRSIIILVIRISHRLSLPLAYFWLVVLPICIVEFLG